MKRLAVLLAAAALALPASAQARGHVLPASVPVPAMQTFPTFGNTAVGDCSFAAAADWTMLRYGAVPTEPEVIAAWTAAGGERGVDVTALEKWWVHRGIAGHRVELGEARATRIATERALAREPVLGEVDLPANQMLGPFTTGTGGYHMLVADGYDATGPYLVTWGETVQVTWAQWEAEAKYIYPPVSVRS